MSWSFSFRKPTVQEAHTELAAALERSNDHIPNEVQHLITSALEALPEAPHDIDVRTHGHVEKAGSGSTSNFLIEVKHVYRQPT